MENENNKTDQPEIVVGIAASSILDELEETILKKEEPINDTETEQAGSVRNNVKQNTHVSLDPFTASTNKHRPEVFVTPPASTIETMTRLNSVTKDEVLAHKNAVQWSDSLRAAMLSSSFDGAADRIFANTEAKWTQRLSFGNVGIGPSGSRAEVERGAVISGSQAVNAVQRHLGIGGSFTAILPHSGFYITLKPPLEETLLELNRQMHNIKTEVGRTTYGLMLDSYSGLINELFVRFALGEMQRNSVKDVDDLLKIISVHDINILIWAYICTIYPNGYNHRAGCIADPSKCAHVVEDLINVRRLFFMNSERFSEEQLKHLTSSSSASMSADSVMKYREEMRKRESKVIVLCEGTEEETRVTMRVPSAHEYFDSTNRWVQGIGVKVIEALGADSSFNERNQLITEHAASTRMRKYSHWVEKIDIGAVIVERESIENTLDAMSSSISLRNEFEEKVAKYVEETCISLIGVPDWKCPSCGQYQITEEGTDPLSRSIVGIDVPMTFFTTLVQRVQFVKE